MAKTFRLVLIAPVLPFAVPAVVLLIVGRAIGARLASWGRLVRLRTVRPVTSA